jgi:hypothetical protein
VTVRAKRQVVSIERKRKKIDQMKTIKIVPSIFALALAVSASASVVTITGNTSATISPTVSSGLTFTGSALNITTDAFGNSGVFSLGSFTIDTTKNSGAVKNSASLFMNIAGDPTSITADTFDTNISNFFNGFYWNHTNDIYGNVGFTLANPGSPTAPVLFSYTDAGGSGSFDLGIVGYSQFETIMGTGDMGWKAIYASGTSVNAQITNAQYTPNVAATPEPSSLLLLGTGITGLAGLIRRKFKSA